MTQMTQWIRNKHESEAGAVLVICMIMLLMLSLIGIASLMTSDTEMRTSSNEFRSSEAFYAAEAGLVLAEKTIWDDYLAASLPSFNKQPGETGTLDSYKYFLGTLGIGADHDGPIIENQEISSSASISSVNVRRTDVDDGVMLELTAQGASIDQARSEILELVKVGTAPFEGFGYAVLANNVNCIMCHATFDNVERYYNNVDSLRGTFDRVKVASLEALLLRDNSDSKISGTLYTRGLVTDKNGNPITDLGTLDGHQIDPTTGKIIEPLTVVDLVNATGSPLPQYANLYLDYPTNEADMTDGPLPETFPPAIPDVNGNRIIDDSEFAEVVANASGKLSGGIKVGLTPGQTYSGSSLPTSGNINQINNSFTGNVILVGTESDPLVINGTVAIDGDVIIIGVVKGEGQIITRGNAYAAGDVVYADGTDGSGNRTFGRADDGTTNAFALTAGGNIAVGDYLTPKNGDILDPSSMDTGDGTSGFSFTMSEITLFNRMEWAKTQQFLPDVNGNLVPNSTYIPGYKPRYYVLGPGDPIYIYNKMDGSGKGTYWDPATESWQGDEHLGSYKFENLTVIDPTDPQYSSAVVSSLAPQGGWVTETQLKQFWIQDENSRTAGEPFKLDGLYYTNNSIFTLTRSTSKTNGTMLANGSLVAADLGVLVPNGLQLNYDNRLQDWVNVPDYSRVQFYRVGWAQR